MNWFEEVGKAIKTITEEEIMEPQSDFEPGDREVGIVTDLDLKKISTYLETIYAKSLALEAIVDAEQAGSARGMMLVQDFVAVIREGQVIEAGFYHSVRTIYELWHIQEPIRIIKGWKIVVHEETSGLRILMLSPTDRESFKSAGNA